MLASDEETSVRGALVILGDGQSTEGRDHQDIILLEKVKHLEVHAQQDDRLKVTVEVREGQG